ncbi:hypothetical protein Q1695_008914 [Nippostrongylus brasiliensis]|nr:hypothetical protein Q1695_008914 [Nippostrongylus brasiliensis]
MDDINPIEEEWKKRGMSLRDYQRVGVATMDSWFNAGHGGINGDEMGLGKTCQAIVMLLRLKNYGRGPFLVVCPLSVCDHWMSEVVRFSCGSLEPIGYYGHEKERREVLEKLGKLRKNIVFICPTHIFRGHSDTMEELQEKSGLSFDVIVIDEAHCVKNLETQLAENFKPYRKSAWFLLMTGTPIQNNIGELYSLLTFVDEVRFPDKESARDAFIRRYTSDTRIPELKGILAQYMIRRTKDEVCKELPSCDQVVLYHNLTDLQKKLYIDIIARDYESLLLLTHNESQSLSNLHMQLRKCVSHPYLFRGIEPEPFEEGEHIIEASGKFQVLDRLLFYLRQRKHRCLIFSQFVIVLDIVQDFLSFRGYDYERIDGSVRAEERYAAINKFQNTGKTRNAADSGPWCFLLTTKSGGVGLNLTGADTVIFLDLDWNPQNDIQAMARCHRIGQDRPVRVIRLVGRYTVEQHMHARIRDKQRFTDRVMGNEEVKLSAFDMLTMIKQSLGTLQEQKNEKVVLTDEELETVIGQTNEAGEWLPLKNDKENQVPVALRLDPDEVDKRDTDCSDYRVFEGRTYRVSSKDEEAFEGIRLLRLAQADSSTRRTRVLGDMKPGFSFQEAEEKMKVLKKERAEIAEKRKKAAEAQKQKTWMANGYVSGNLPEPTNVDYEDDAIDMQEDGNLFHVHGDVTRPQRSDGDNTTRSLILHCVDNGGTFGNGGVFSALRAKDPSIAEKYELISRMGDMKIGDAHLIQDVQEMRGDGVDALDSGGPSTSSETHEDVVLLIAQSSKRRGEMRPSVLERCFSRIGEHARRNNASVHLPRIGYGTSLSWYTVERLIKKCIANRGVPTYIYYFARASRPRGFSPTKAPPPKRPARKKTDDFVIDNEELEDEEEITATSSSESEWSGEEEGSIDIESDDDAGDDVSDEEVDELKEDWQSRPCRTSRRRRTANIELRNSSGNVTCASKEESDLHGYVTPEHNGIFWNMAISVFGVPEKTANDLVDLIVENGGYPLSAQEELHDATHAVMSDEVLEDASLFKKFRELFSDSCVFIKGNWIVDCIKAKHLIKTEMYEACI